MNTNEWLGSIAEKVPSTIDPDHEFWVTKSRGDYITHVGMEDKVEHFPKLGITEHVSSIWEAGKPICIGFNPIEQKWYGWSHRAIFGFGIGSECKKGDCHYRPVDKDDFLDDMIRFWSGENHVNITGEHTGDGVYVEWEYDQLTPNEKIRGTTSGAHSDYPDEFGKGEWVAKSLSDARQMAVDFSDGVS
jgi:hypothetical protein